MAGLIAFDDYRLEYVNDRYSLWVDGVRTMGPVGSPRRPDSLWVGNPVMTFWGTTDWMDFALDSVGVSVQRYPLTVSTDGTGAGVITNDLLDLLRVQLPAVRRGYRGHADGDSERRVGVHRVDRRRCSGTGTCIVTLELCETSPRRSEPRRAHYRCREMGPAAA